MSNVPNLIILGTSAFDNKKFVNGVVRNDIGGACIYASLPASLFYKVGVVTKVGYDFPLEVLDDFNIDKRGIKVMRGEKTTSFQITFLSEDGKQRIVRGGSSIKMSLQFSDIPECFLKAKSIHITTVDPNVAVSLIKQIRKKSFATISIDTIKDLAEKPETKEAFDLADVAFIDDEFSKLKKCLAPVKIIKRGKNGCVYTDKLMSFEVIVKERCRVVDKSGAGDCMNGVFMNLLTNGWPKQKALQKACEVATLSIGEYGMLPLCLGLAKKHIYDII